MKKVLSYLFYIMGVLVFLMGCTGEDGSRKIPKLTETYSYKDKKPFGAFIAYRQLEEIFYRNTIRTENRNFEESWKILEDTGSVYISISRSLYTTHEDVNSIVDYAQKGNDVFLCAEEFDNNLLEKLECRLETDIRMINLYDSIYTNTGLLFNPGLITDNQRYAYYYRPFSKRFSGYNKTNTRVIGLNDKGDPDYIVIFLGKGRVFLHCAPRAFSNYFLLQKDNYHYLEKAFGFLNGYPEHVYWNNYYVKLRSKQQALNKRDDDGFNSLSEILSHPQLATAFWLSLILLLLFVFYGMKRRQRIIALVKPNENTTVTFTETIGRLYLQKQDNKNIAEKMITYFNEYIRNNYFLNTHAINDAFVTTLSRKSGVQREKVESLYRAIDHAHQNSVIDDFQLLSLNEQMQDFFKRMAK